jgi:hypothetical protein
MLNTSLLPVAHSHKIHLSHTQCQLIKNIISKAISDIAYCNVLATQQSGSIWPENNHAEAIQLMIMFAELPVDEVNSDLIHGFCL